MFRTKSRFVTALVILTGFAALILFAPSAIAKKKDKYIERFSARALSIGNIVPGASSTVDIAIARWTTSEERAELLRVLVEEGQEAFVDALGSQPEAGFVRFSGSLGHRLRYAWERNDGERRQLVFATDRPIAPEETARSTRTLDYPVSLVLLDIDAEGNGEGKLALAAQFTVNEEERVLELEFFDVEPVRLTSVHKSK